MTSTVHLEIPASGAYLSVARAAATGLAAQLQFTYEEIDDLRIAVDEACTQLLARRGSATTLNLAYHLAEAELRVDVSIEAADRGEPLERDTFAWQILSAMTDEVREQSEDGRLRLSFRKAGGRG
ncbi:MAG TPA: anti-sigma regulatory factor [Actinomycetes bacterium]|jgi:serine/threonine-protein kinase RsbW|nr:anti-sigma regulatory factor [Actinomycetes bacterium]HEX2155708.1 anti-sigma regulatory factor [Actinomycetes bacterium]